ncbi:MAG TPA: hypothetical protein PKG54_17490 [Phycisphaerae bacterium]|jgi:hypothetical protein|nr:hypothetical protein [Phycisphaerae bacterium]HOB76307.1 hypothetical protein [Phycisphaerae bacterium]HOJ53797.1 hypothetical protein [Phycisphaerae bacterium]HOL28271.1 hypothetical protein [Phycisphaerae bacterium]HPP21479.1 hypothetical protein [Phycisphaerae bacterium]
MVCGSLFRRCSRRFGRGVGLKLAGLALCLAGWVPGCQPPAHNVIMGVNGPIRLEAITRILDNPELTEDQKRQELRNLGITDEDLIDVLIRGL